MNEYEKAADPYQRRSLRRDICCHHFHSAFHRIRHYRLWPTGCRISAVCGPFGNLRLSSGRHLRRVAGRDGDTDYGPQGAAVAPAGRFCRPSGFESADPRCCFPQYPDCRSGIFVCFNRRHRPVSVRDTALGESDQICSLSGCFGVHGRDRGYPYFGTNRTTGRRPGSRLPA